MFGGSGTSKATKCKTQLRLVVSRIHILRRKREIQVKHLRRDVALLLQNNQEGNARARIEHAIREQNMVDAYTLIEGYCQFLDSRIQSISGRKECPPELKEAVASLIYAGPRCADLPELLEIRSIFSAKYGKQFIATILELRVGCGVSKKILDKLSSQPLSAETKINFMTEVAKEHNVRWQPADLSIPSDFNKPEGLPQQVQTQANTQQNTKNSSSPKSPLDHRKPATPAIHSTRTQQETKSDSEDEPAVSKPAGTNPVETAAHRQQFVPFVQPTTGPAPSTDPYAQYTKGIINPYSQKEFSPPPPPPPQPATTNGDPYEEYRKKFMGDHAYADVATAAEAAAQSADYAAAAARAAATLANKHLSRESSMTEEAVAAAAVSKVPILKTKVSPVNLEDRVSSYLNSHVNETDSSEWDTPSPLPRGEHFQMINPSRDLRKEAEGESREQVDLTTTHGSYYERRHRRRPAIPEKQHHGDDESLFRKESSPEKKLTGSPLGKPLFDDFAGNDHLIPSKLQENPQPVFDDFTGNDQFGPRKLQENRQPVYDDFIAAPAARDDGRDSGYLDSKPVFDEAPAPAVSKLDSFTRNMETMHGNLQSRTDKMFEKEDSDLSSPASRPRRVKGNFGVLRDHEDESSGNLDTEFKTQATSIATPIPTQEESSSWKSRPPPTRPPPKLRTEMPKLHTEEVDPSAKHLDFQRQFHSAGVDYSEKPSSLPGATRKHRLGGSSVRTKRA